MCTCNFCLGIWTFVETQFHTTVARMFVSYVWSCWHTPGILDLRMQKELRVIHQGHSEFKTEGTRGKIHFTHHRIDPAIIGLKVCTVEFTMFSSLFLVLLSVVFSPPTPPPLPESFQLRCWNRVPNMLHGETSGGRKRGTAPSSCTSLR